MHIDSNQIKNDAVPVAESTFSSKGIRGIGAIIQRVYNAPLWRDPTCRTSFLCGTLVSIAACAGAYLISSAVDDINDLLAPCETLSKETYTEVKIAGLKWGILGGLMTGLGAAAIIRRCYNITDVDEDCSQLTSPLLRMGTAIGLSFGGIAGMLYSISLQQVHNADYTDLVCYDHPPVIINERHFNM